MKRSWAFLLAFVLVVAGYTLTRSSFIRQAPSSACVAADFTPRWVTGTGAAGTLYAWVQMKKVSTHHCYLSGWPNMTLSASGGASTPGLTHQSRDAALGDWNSRPLHVRKDYQLWPTKGQYVGVALSFVDDSTCGRVARLRLAWDHTSISVRPSYMVFQCNVDSGQMSQFFIAQPAT